MTPPRSDCCDVRLAYNLHAIDGVSLFCPGCGKTVETKLYDNKLRADLLAMCEKWEKIPLPEGIIVRGAICYPDAAHELRNLLGETK